MLSWLILSCADDPQVETPSVNDIAKLTSSSYVLTRSAAELKLYVGASGMNLPIEHLKYDVHFYKIEYLTHYKGEDITASGIVMVPDTHEPVSVLSYQHGTIVSNSEAPSQLKTSDYELIIYQGIASAGLMVLVPDYIGFGSSAHIMHPYYVERLTASAIIDHLYGAKNLADKIDLNLDGYLYLAGYSQGGYATMAAQKYMEENSFDAFDLKASFVSSGGYDIPGMQHYFFEQTVYHQPFFLAYVAHAYHETLDLSTDLSTYFNEPYATAIPGYFDGSLPGKTINDLLNDSLHVLVNNEYLHSEANDPRFSAMNEAFSQNSLLDWTPDKRLYLYHGDADITVPYQNSVDTYHQLIANGASESVVSLTTLSDDDHGTGYFSFLEEFIGELIAMEKL